LPNAGVEQSRVADLDVSLPEVPKLPLATYTATLERPVFSESRSPVVSTSTQEVVPKQNSSTPNMRVAAIIIRDGERKAMFEFGNPPKQHLVSEGGSVSGWEVAKIAEQSVTVASAGREHRIELMQFSPPQARKVVRPNRVPPPGSSRLNRPVRPPRPGTRQPNDID
jgi:type II secretory pathway component PulC